MRIPDTGTGSGDLFASLALHGLDSYLGIGVVPGPGAMGQEQYGTDGRFKLVGAELLDVSPKGDFNVAFVSGMFKFRIANGRTYDFIADALARAFGLGKVAVAANSTTDRIAYEEDPTFYVYDCIVQAQCFVLTRRVNLGADCCPIKFSIFLDKEDSLSPESAISSACRGEA